jgi:hypothetical protein
MQLVVQEDLRQVAKECLSHPLGKLMSTLSALMNNWAHIFLQSHQQNSQPHIRANSHCGYVSSLRLSTEEDQICSAMLREI